MKVIIFLDKEGNIGHVSSEVALQYVVVRDDPNSEQESITLSDVYENDTFIENGDFTSLFDSEDNKKKVVNINWQTT